MLYRIGAVVAVIVLLSSISLAAPLNPSDIIVSLAGVPSSYVQEYTPSGTLVQSWDITSSGLFVSFPRDIGVDASGNIVVYNGTDSPINTPPTLTVINPTTGVRNDYSYAGWNTANVLYLGALAVSGHYAYATDDEVSNDSPNQNGIVRFNTTDGSAQRYLAGTGTTSVAYGLNNILYVVSPDTNPGQNQLTLMDSASMSVIKTVNLPVSVTGATADAFGNIYATSGNTIYELDDRGNILRSLATSYALGNIKISPSNQLICDNNGGQIVLTTTALSSYSEWSVSTSGDVVYAYADFAAPLPEPAAISLVAPSLLLLLRRSRSARKGAARV